MRGRTARGVPPTPPPRVALDAMGGDAAPDAVVAGALAARGHGIDVVLVGREDAVATAQRAAGAADDPLPVVAADAVVAMDDALPRAVRARPDASIRVATRLVAQGRADAVVSAGPTGATLTAALMELGRVSGVRRPAVAVVVPLRGPTAPNDDGGPRSVVLVDAGGSADAPVEVVPGHARLGAAYAEVRGVPRPRIGLLNVGAEAGKGSALARAAHDLLRDVDGFVGNVEPGDVLAGAVDVVVTDGFTGNVFLKTLEAVGRQRDKVARAGGAGVLLGVAGDVLVAHGAASGRDVADAVVAAAAAGEAQLSRRVAARLAGRSGGRPPHTEGTGIPSVPERSRA